MNPSWRVIIRHEPRSLRRVDDQEHLVFGAGGAVEDVDLVPPTASPEMQPDDVPEGDEIQGILVRAVDSITVEEEDEAHLADMQYSEDEDEV